MSDQAIGWLIAAIVALGWIIFRCAQMIVAELRVANGFAEVNNTWLLQIREATGDARDHLSSIESHSRSIDEEICRMQTDIARLRRQLAPSEDEIFLESHRDR